MDGLLTVGRIDVFFLLFERINVFVCCHTPFPEVFVYVHKGGGQDRYNRSNLFLVVSYSVLKGQRRGSR